MIPTSNFYKTKIFWLILHFFLALKPNETAKKTKNIFCKCVLEFIYSMYPFLVSEASLCQKTSTLLYPNVQTYTVFSPHSHPLSFLLRLRLHTKLQGKPSLLSVGCCRTDGPHSGYLHHCGLSCPIATR